MADALNFSTMIASVHREERRVRSRALGRDEEHLANLHAAQVVLEGIADRPPVEAIDTAYIALCNNLPWTSMATPTQIRAVINLVWDTLRAALLARAGGGKCT